MWELNCRYTKHAKPCVNNVHTEILLKFEIHICDGQVFPTNKINFLLNIIKVIYLIVFLIINSAFFFFLFKKRIYVNYSEKHNQIEKDKYDT